MLRQIKTLKDVVDWGLCTGCGACVFSCRSGGVTLVDIESLGIRPRFEPDCESCTACLSICPGHRVEAATVAAAAGNTNGNHPELGPALEIWEGYAADPEIRFRSASGGLLTALALYCLEREGMGSVLHTAMDESRPWANKTVQSYNRSELLARSGSRYATSSPCEGLRGVQQSRKPCVFIGKPCDAAAIALLSSSGPQPLNIGLALTFFCGGTPSTRGARDLAESLGIAPNQVRAVRYRGDGWPGKFTVTSCDGNTEKSLPYGISWDRLAKYRPWRCHICPDGLGQSADISCGDAWERLTDIPEAGHSIVIVRTERGRDILRRAIEANYVKLERIGPEAVIAAQHGVLRRRREIFGRILVMRLLLIPTPRFSGFCLLQSWARLSSYRRLRVIAGTFKRVLARGLWRKRPLC